MNTLKWLIRRELWEHRGAFIRAPLAVAAVLVLLIGGGFLYGMAASGGVQFQVNGDTLLTINGVPQPARMHIAALVASNYLAITAPLFLVLPVVAFFYCLATLHDDRRDRSILFWKSLPLSDGHTVLSKALVPLVVAPLITVAIGIAAALVLVVIGLLGGAVNGANLIAPVLANRNFYLAPLYLISLLPVYILWALPSVGWLLLVSSWARSKVFLWAVGLPLVTLGLLAWFNFLMRRFGGPSINYRWFGEEVVARILGGLFPGIWFGDIEGAKLATEQLGIDGPTLLGLSYATLLTPGVWVAGTAGCAMLYGAVRVRRWRDEG